LQQIDSQLDAANARMLSLEKSLLDDSSILTAQQVVTQTEGHHKSLSKNMHDAEVKSYDTRVKIELAEASLYGGKIQNPKELQELQNDIASLKRLLITLEDKQLEAMMEVEGIEERLMWANEGLHETQKIQSERNTELSGEKTKLKSQIERLESERKVTLPTITAPDLGLYEQLRKSRSGVAVVKITSKACTACGTTLTAALVQAAQLTGQLVRCPTCSRILYPG
jgi:predicted  nucleic acid-binding Zn-ribbon protein